MADLASRQHGAVAARQLLDLGLSRREIQSRVETGRLHHAHPGVYFVGYVPKTPHGRYMAATLAIGPGAALSHHSSAALWDLWDHHRHPHVTSTRSARSPNGIRRHWTRTLEPQDVTKRHGIPATNLKRTLIDLADVLAPDPFEALLRRAEAHNRIDRAQLTPIPGRKGATKLERAHELTRSHAETAFRKAVRQAKLPRPDYNAPWHTYEIDALWPKHRLAVEIDGYEHHRSRHAFRTDRSKGNALTAAGYKLLRFTYEDVIDHPRRTTDEVARALG